MNRSSICLATFALLAFAPLTSLARQEKDADPVYDGKKASAWVKSLIDDSSARKRALAINALAKLWADKRYEDALPQHQPVTPAR